MAELERLRGDHQQALAALLTAAGMSGETPARVTAALAELMAELGHAVEAERLARSVPLDDSDAAAIASRTLVRLARRSGADGREPLEALRGSAGAHAALASILEDELDRPDEAAAVWQQALEAAEPETDRVLELGLARCLAATGKLDEARAGLERVAAAEPASAALRSALAHTRARVALAAAHAAGTDALFEEARTRIDEALMAADAAKDRLAAIQAHRSRVALAAARQDLDGVIDALGAVIRIARPVRLAAPLFDALEDHARALRIRRDLTRAKGELGLLDTLAAATTLPDHEARAAAAAGEYARDLGLDDEARAAYRAAVDVLEAAGDTAGAAAYREFAS